MRNSVARLGPEMDLWEVAKAGRWQKSSRFSLIANYDRIVFATWDG